MKYESHRSLLLRIPEVAAELRLARSSIYELIQAGELPVVRIGRALRIPRAGLEDWVERQRHEQSKR
ncbi:helix-turn-helix domain-containing protein [Nitrolancea hollandica]|uniref:Putative excisionase n=1 Tax=Nitrolancea hollandica Lb TaxID=1129897 RepID=I4ECF6_9BACT